MCKPLKSWKLSCPVCGATELIGLNLNDLTVITCDGCGDSFSPEIAVKLATEHLHRWQAVATWIRQAGATPEAATAKPDPESTEL